MAVVLHDLSDVFFRENSADIFLTKKAAIEVCQLAFSEGIVILAVEPFIHTISTIQPRWDLMWRQGTEVDAIWPMDEIEEHNSLVARYIERCDSDVNAYVLTGWPIDSDTSPFAPAEG